MPVSSLLTLLLLLLLFKTICIKSQSTICFIGDAFYGNSDIATSWNSNIDDPRTMMGTFTLINVESTDSILDIDFTSGVYKHSNYAESESNYIFKINSVGWVITKNASPNTAISDKIVFTCFHDDIISCDIYSWFVGYNSINNPIEQMKITDGKCNSDMCMDNFKMTIITNNNNNDNININTYELNGLLKAISPNEPCQSDTVVCDSNRTYWINQRDTSYRWYYRLTQKNANWVYGRSGSDRIACAPGYVESPLFCTTFVYASDNNDGNYTNYIFKSGACLPTPSPTKQPSISPSNKPSYSPTPAPSDIPSCPKDYIFKPIVENSNITLLCPFGWIGTQIKRECQLNGIWNTISDDCNLISFTDNFNYFRDELWINDNNQISAISNGEYIAKEDIILSSYAQFKLPLRIDFSGFVSGATNCGGFNIDLINTNSQIIDISNKYNCNQRILSIKSLNGDIIINDTENDNNIPNGDTIFPINGYIIYRTESKGEIGVYSQNDQNGNITKIIDTNISTTIKASSQQLSLSSLIKNNNKQFIYTKISLTTFIDWFNPPLVTGASVVNDQFSNLWTSAPISNSSDYSFVEYNSNLFLNIDPQQNQTQLELKNGAQISSDSTKFQFISPFSMSMIFNNLNTDTTINISTSTSKRRIFPPYDNNLYESINAQFRIDSDTIYITLNGEIFKNETYLDCNNDTNYYYMKIMVNTRNISIIVYDYNMDECGILTMIDELYLESSSLNWNSLTIKPTTSSDISIISYFEAISGEEEEIITDSPTKLPTPAPSDILNECISPINNSKIYYENEEININCNYGSKGDSNNYKCLSDSTWLFTQGCFVMSFGDNFLDFNKDIFQVIDPLSISGKVALDPFSDGGLRFLPQSKYAVNVMKSVNVISYPMKVTASFSKQINECNNWFIALGTSYTLKTSNSILLSWECSTNTVSITNSSYTLQDRQCWNNNQNDTLIVNIIATRSSVSVYFDNLGCSDLFINANLINPYNNDIIPYLWFGSFQDDENKDIDLPIVGRLSNIFYTQFYTQFDSNNVLIWSNYRTLNIDESENMAIMYPGDELIADNQFEFTLPFIIKMSIERPFDRNEYIDGGNGEEIIYNGRYAHWIVIGDNEYSNKTRDGIIQIVYDGQPKSRFIIGNNAIYVNSDNCQWRLFGKIIQITIEIDENYVSVTDDFCDTILYGKHNLNKTVTKMAIGMVKFTDYDDTDFIAFDSIAVYQQPLIYSNQLLSQDNLELSDIKTYAQIYDIVPDNTIYFLGYDILYWIIGGGILIILCCCMYCFIAWCLKCFPFGSKKNNIPDKETNTGDASRHEKVKSNTYSNTYRAPLNEPITAEANNRFETNATFKDEEHDETNRINAEAPTDDDDDDDGDYDSKNNNNNNNNPNANYGVIQAPISPDPNSPHPNSPHANSPNGRPYGQSDAQLQQHNLMMSRQLFLQRQFIEFMMTNPGQQATLMSLGAEQRKQYIQQEMIKYVNHMNQNLQQIGPEILNQQMMMMNTNTNINNGEGGHGVNNGGFEGTGYNTGMYGMGGFNTNSMMNMGQYMPPSQQQRQQQQQAPQQGGYQSPAMIRLANANNQHSMPNRIGGGIGIGINNNNNNNNNNVYELPPQPQIAADIEMQNVDYQGMSFASEVNALNAGINQHQHQHQNQNQNQNQYGNRYQE